MDATLTGSATRDFNVMTRRGHARAIVQVWKNGGIVSRDADQAVWYCAHGQYRFLGALVPAGYVLRTRRVMAGVRLFAETPDAILIGALITLKGSE